MKILLAVDGSPFTSKAASYLASHMKCFKDEPELHLLHVKLPIPISQAANQARRILGDEAVTEFYKEESEAALAPAEEILRAANIPFHSHYEVGKIAQKINAYVQEEKIDMIVMGSHGHDALANVVLGSVATKILATAAVPVLIVR